jgi:hypothetical protein
MPPANDVIKDVYNITKAGARGGKGKLNYNMTLLRQGLKSDTIGRIDQITTFVETYDRRPLKYTQIYAMSRLLIVTLSIKHVVR